MTVTRKGKLNTYPAKLENAQKRGLIVAGILVSQRATNKAPVDTGRLKRSITHSMPERRGRVMVVDIGTNVEYAPEQESRKPYLRPSLEESKQDVIKLLSANIAAAFR